MRAIMRIMPFQLILVASFFSILLQSRCIIAAESLRERISINEEWRFHKYKASEKGDGLIYDVRPDVRNNQDGGNHRS